MKNTLNFPLVNNWEVVQINQGVGFLVEIKNISNSIKSWQLKGEQRKPKSWQAGLTLQIELKFVCI